MTYEYECKNPDCGHEWEAQQKISEDAMKVCPKCEQETARRLISGGHKRGAILKGTGWFGTGGY